MNLKIRDFLVLVCFCMFGIQTGLSFLAEIRDVMQNCARNGGFCINTIPPPPLRKNRQPGKKRRMGPRMGGKMGAGMGAGMGGRRGTRTRKGRRPKPSPRAVSAQHNVLPKGAKPTNAGMAAVNTQPGFMPRQYMGYAPQAPGLTQFTGYAQQPAFPQNTGYAPQAPAFPQNTGYAPQAPAFPQNTAYAQQQVPAFPQNTGYAPQAPISWQTMGSPQQPQQQQQQQQQAPAAQSNKDPFAGLFNFGSGSGASGMSQMMMMGLLSRKKRQAEQPPAAQTGPIAPLFEPGEAPTIKRGQSVYSFLDQNCLKAEFDFGCRKTGGMCCRPHPHLL